MVANRSDQRRARDVVVSVAVVMLSLALSANAQPAASGSDHPLVGRFDGATLVGYEQKNFDARAVVVKGSPDRSLVASDVETVEGKYTLLAYAGPQRSAVEIFRNFQLSLKARGFTEAFICANNPGQPKGCPDRQQIAYRVVHLGAPVLEYRGPQCFKNSRHGLFRKGEDATVALLVSDCLGDQDPPLTLLSVIESATMDADQIRVPTASEMSGAFAMEGKIALYGIFFDTGKWDVKPESRPTLQAIAELFTGRPTDRLWCRDDGARGT